MSSEPQSVLVFDIETNGLPENYLGSVYDFDNWPRVVQVAWARFDQSRNRRASGIKLIKPNGWKIPSESTAVHGITTNQAETDGEPLEQVLSSLAASVGRATVLVAHNILFDERILYVEYLRLGLTPPFNGNHRRVCTMLGTRHLFGRDWPKLSELYLYLFPNQVDVFLKLHDARADTTLCALAYFELVDRGILE